MNVNPFSYLIEKLKGKVDKSGDTMQYLSIDRPSATTSATTSYAMLGNNVAEGNIGNSYGLIYLYGKGIRYTQIDAPDSTANRTIHLPNASGTLALTSDIATIITLTQADFTWDSGNKYFTSNNTVSQIVGSKTIENIDGYFTNGSAILGYRINFNGKINVMGWIPSIGQSIDSVYTFTINIFAR